MSAPEERDFSFYGFAFEGRANIGSVDGAILRGVDAYDAEHGGEDIRSDHGSFAYGAGRDLTRPTNEARNADSALVAVAFATTKSSGGALSAAGLFATFGAVVGCEEDDGAVALAKIIESLHHDAEGVVELGDVAVMLADPFVINVRVRLHVFLS